MAKWSLFLKSEKTKPSEKKGFVVGPMVSFEWEKVTASLSKFFSRRKK